MRLCLTSNNKLVFWNGVNKARYIIILECPSICYCRSDSLPLEMILHSIFHQRCQSPSLPSTTITTTSIAPNKFSYRSHFFTIDQNQNLTSERNFVNSSCTFPFHLVTLNYCFGVSSKSFCRNGQLCWDGQMERRVSARGDSALQPQTMPNYSKNLSLFAASFHWVGSFRLICFDEIC